MRHSEIQKGTHVYRNDREIFRRIPVATTIDGGDTGAGEIWKPSVTTVNPGNDSVKRLQPSLGWRRYSWAATW